MLSNEVKVYFTDGSSLDCVSIADAELAITDAVIGSNFEIQVDSIESEKWPSLACSWNCKLQ